MTATEKQEKILKKEECNGLKISPSRLKRIIFYIIGYISLALGIIGLIIPILPTTPFLLLSAACFARNSEKMYKWLTTNKLFGKIIRDYRAGKGIPIKVKAYTLFFLWFTIIISIVLISILWVRILLLLIATGVTVHVILIRPKRRD